MEIKTGTAPNSGNYKSGRTDSIKYIVVHYTGNSGDTALNNINYFAENVTGSSAHYFVDENDIYQSVPDSDTAWHCGTSGTYYHSECRNANSISVEMCNFVNVNESVQENAAKLVKYLMDKYGIDTDHVLRHYDVTHKNCPAPFVEDTAAWENFKNLLKGDESMTKFTDISGHFAQEHIEKLESYGIINGVDTDGDGIGDKFYPDEPITRAQAAVMIANALTVCGK